MRLKEYDLFFSIYTGYAPEYRNDHPGTFLLMNIIEEMSYDEKIKFFDFGFGDTRYKKNFSNRCWEEAIVHIYAPTAKGIQLNIMNSFTAFINQAAVRCSKKLKLYDKIKRIWRTRLAEERHPKGVFIREYLPLFFTIGRSEV
jgi:CelD/BcsL family acetyltransferase involved in cellulose biosynthesis